MLFSTETYRESPDGGFITTSRVTVTLNHLDNNAKIQCRARNPNFADTVSDTKTLTVLCKYFIVILIILNTVGIRASMTSITAARLLPTFISENKLDVYYIILSI